MNKFVFFAALLALCYAEDDEYGGWGDRIGKFPGGEVSWRKGGLSTGKGFPKGGLQVGKTVGLSGKIPGFPKGGFGGLPVGRSGFSTTNEFGGKRFGIPKGGWVGGVGRPPVETFRFPGLPRSYRDTSKEDLAGKKAYIID